MLTIHKNVAGTGTLSLVSAGKFMLHCNQSIQVGQLSLKQACKRHKLVVQINAGRLVSVMICMCLSGGIGYGQG
jgi:hypothetical protein